MLLVKLCTKLSNTNILCYFKRYVYISTASDAIGNVGMYYVKGNQMPYR